MEKTVTMKIAKGDDQKKRLKMISNSLIKVLRPRVFIIEASDFKRLVQELTGNSSHSPQQSIPHSHPPCPCPSNEVSSSLETQAFDDFAEIVKQADYVSVHFTGEVACVVPWWHPSQVQIHEQQLDKNEIPNFGAIKDWLVDIDSLMRLFERYVAAKVSMIL